ncbi:MAG: DUF2783 domain-containing protein [Pseudolabrys sp.]|nr:DUF2783 domain-containing protein [Pseudolabrys sp.]
MSASALSLDELEALWALLAERITQAETQSEVFLTKLAVLLANEVGDYQRVLDCVNAASKDQRPVKRSV